jgi:peptide-methionine (S)-S-oxide reductase
VKPFFAIAAFALMSTLSHSQEPQASQNSASLILGGGCFWCVEAVFETAPGVLSVTSGYAGGTTKNPTYDQVCSGKTGHAEVVRIEYDPSVTTYRRLVDLFWKAHDPTTLNRQGADVGTQYRSILLYANDTEKAAAMESRDAAQKDFKSPIVTEIAEATEFYPAEHEHQDFYRRNPNHPYNRAVIQPKLEKLGKE